MNDIEEYVDIVFGLIKGIETKKKELRLMVEATLGDIHPMASTIFIQRMRARRDNGNGQGKRIDRDHLLKELHERMKRYPEVEIIEDTGWLIVKKDKGKMDAELFNAYKSDLKNMGFRWNKNGNYWELRIK